MTISPNCGLNLNAPEAEGWVREHRCTLAGTLAELADSANSVYDRVLGERPVALWRFPRTPHCTPDRRAHPGFPGPAFDPHPSASFKVFRGRSGITAPSDLFLDGPLVVLARMYNPRKRHTKQTRVALYLPVNRRNLVQRHRAGLPAATSPVLHIQGAGRSAAANRTRYNGPRIGAEEAGPLASVWRHVRNKVKQSRNCVDNVLPCTVYGSQTRCPETCRIHIGPARR